MKDNSEMTKEELIALGWVKNPLDKMQEKAEKQLTAVEWFNQQLVDRQNGNGDSRSRDEIFEQAKVMEKEQKIEFAEKYANSDSFYCSGEFDIVKGAEQYYNETFKSE